MEVKKINGLADLTPIFGDIEYIPIATYLFSNICLVVGEEKKIVLVLTEERVKKNIWVLPGGELWYKILESFENAMIREVEKEELGIKINPERAKIFDARIGYPVKRSPYEDKGITSVIISYAYFITEEEFAKINVNKISKKGYDIKKIMIKPVLDIIEDVEDGTINVYPETWETLLKLEQYLKKGN